MGFKSSHNNPIRDLVELSARFDDSQNKGVVGASVTLHIAPGEIEIDEYTIEIRFRAAFLVLEPDNLTPDINSYFGLRVKPSSVMNVSQYREQSRLGLGSSTKSATEGELAISPLGGALKGNQKFERGSNSSSEYTIERNFEKHSVHQFVEYNQNDRWKITEENAAPLKGTYLLNERICTLHMPDGKPNKVGGTLHLIVRRKDIDVNIEGKSIPEVSGIFSAKNKNKKSVLDALVTNRLRSVCVQKNEADITFATVENEHEG